MGNRPLGDFAVCGVNAVEAALLSPRTVPRQLLVHAGRLNPRLEALAAKARERRVPVEAVLPDRLERAAGGVVHQGAVLFLASWPSLDEGDLGRRIEAPGPPPFLVLLDHLQDVGNVGAIIRSAYLCGADGVVLPRARSAPVSPAMVRASAGTAAGVDLYVVANMAAAVNRLKDGNIWVYGLDGAPESDDIVNADLATPLALVVGAEDEGLSRLVRERCDRLLRLPMAAEGSFNASVAAGIALFELRRRRFTGPRRPE